MPLDVRKTFASWRELMTGVKLELSHLDPHGAEFLQRRRELADALQMMDTVAGELIDQALASLMLRTAQLEEATVLLSARAAGLALAETPMVFAERVKRSAKSSPSRPGRTACRRSRQHSSWRGSPRPTAGSCRTWRGQLTTWCCSPACSAGGTTRAVPDERPGQRPRGGATHSRRARRSRGGHPP